MKAYYTDVSNANLDAIRALKEEAAEARRQRAAAEKVAADTGAENRRLVEPLAQVHLSLLLPKVLSVCPGRTAMYMAIACRLAK
jgi:hypothetical protein